MPGEAKALIERMNMKENELGSYEIPEDNGVHPAFPRKFPLSNGSIVHYPGLTKREYFAGLAMQGILACNVPIPRVELVCIQAVKWADALLAALEKKK